MWLRPIVLFLVFVDYGYGIAVVDANGDVPRKDPWLGLAPAGDVCIPRMS